MSMTVSIRVERKTSKAQVNGQRDHDERIGNQPDYVDGERTHLNSILLHQPDYEDLKRECENLRKTKGGRVRGMRSDAVVSWAGIVTFGIEAQKVIESISKEEQDQLFKQAVTLVAKKLKTVATSCAVHRDESAIHAHFSMLGIDNNGNSLSKTTNKFVYAQLQDEVGKVYNEYGITRGKTKAQRIMDGDPPSKIIHKTVQQLHEDLPRELDALKQKQAELIEALAIDNVRAEVARGKAAKAEADEKAKAENVDKLKKRAENYEARAETKQKELDEIEATLGKLRGLLPEPKPVMVKKTEKKPLKESMLSSAQQYEVVIDTVPSKQKYYREDDIDAILFQAKSDNEKKMQEIKDENKKITEENTRLNKRMDEFAAAERIVMFERLGGKTVIEVAQEITDARTPPPAPSQSHDHGMH